MHKTACPILAIAVMSLSACSGAMVAGVMPGETVTVGGNTFTVRTTDAGATVQNFETGRTSPAVLLENASRAAQQVTGCTIDTIIKDGIANTYYATTTCPSA